jgi:hypothetical protein
LTNYEELARFLALAIHNLGGSMKISKELLDNMPPTRLVWDSTSEPDYITLATISNNVIELVVEKSSDKVTEDGKLRRAQESM